MYVNLADLTTYMQPDVLLSKIDDEGTGELDLTPSTQQAPNPQYDRVMQALEGASEEADSYLAVRYPLPLSSTPKSLKEKVLNIAVYKVWSRKGIAPDSADELIRTNYTDAIKWLEKISKGEVLLTSITLPEESPQGSTGMSVVTRERRGW
ncbi:gp436 family protein [Deinococcus cellulosilyticus]|uniref:DUF1320 domain-containing protein n=1 Tax=Deinococcus cellulosilyticus (strain DSM 18568 / NBRC 106333 / KACC 11606 / 5516J-15) TaxID=1223518 RepID=A0A511MW66_DEIC1|nr:DUF1320 domain-containing protein [Deinococcus cellulosilyticus]GEM44825.1 hypothetical protein DC3_04600 [Deinococcus cellulosilyticus NBRC 106333 = KACC 11606]